jgi:Fur family transcriptional regulator, iron response regulator
VIGNGIRRARVSTLESKRLPELSVPYMAQPAPHPTNREDVSDLLRRHGIAPTHQRIAIAQALFARCEHLSADQILAAVNSRHCETSKATVYNTLRLFLEKKLVREVIVDPGKTFYDPNTSPHHHFYNTASGELTDIPADNLSVAGLPSPPAGMLADSIDIIVRIRPGDAPPP